MCKEQKRHGYDDRLKYMKMIEDGYSIDYISKHYGISHKDLDVLWLKYQKDGPSGLVKKKKHITDGKLRETIIRDIETNCLSLAEAAVKYDVCVNRIVIWRRIVEKGGYSSLYNLNTDMGRPKKKKLEEMTELERALYENERLRAENALLKKVKALIEEREAQLRNIGRKPSKN